MLESAHQTHTSGLFEGLELGDLDMREELDKKFRVKD